MNKKILFYINSISYGGAEKVLVNLANSLSINGYQVIVVTSFKDDEEYILHESVKRLLLDSGEEDKTFLKRNISRVLKLRKICTFEKPSIVISFMAEPNFRSIIATRFLGIKTLISVRNDPNMEYKSLLFKILAHLLFPLVDGCVFQTEDAKKWFSKYVQKKSRIVFNQVDENFFNVNFSGNRQNIVTVGRLEKQKNHKLLIKAFSNVAEYFTSDDLHIYGNGSLFFELQEYIKDLNLEKRVFLKGTFDNLHEVIHSSKLFVLSSNYEGLPNALMEAMTMGIPVISTDCPCGGPKLLVENETSGILVPVEDESELTKAIIRVLTFEDLQKSFSINARIKSQDFHPEVVFKTWKSYIEEITSN